jgi:hypothetical protein
MLKSKFEQNSHQNCFWFVCLQLVVVVTTPLLRIGAVFLR